MNSTLYERFAILAAVDPIDGATTARSSSWVDISKFPKFAGIALAGAITGTIDAKLEQATSNAGAGAKDVSGKAITQLTASDDNKQAVINCSQEDLDFNNGFKYVRLTITPTGGSTNLLGGLLIGGDLRYGPPEDFDATTVAEVV
jgi:hypothetical protein